MDSLARTGGNACYDSGLLTATGAETVYDTTVVIPFSIDGKLYRKAAVTDGATPTTDAVTGAAFEAVTPDKGCVFVWTLNASGTVGLVQGELQDMDGDTDAFKIEPQFPSIPDTLVPFAYMVYSTAGTAAAAGLKPGSDNWNSTGLTVTIVNVSRLPSRPQVS